MCRQVDDRRGVARCLSILGMVAYREADLTTARTLHEKSLALNREVDDRWGTAWALHLLAMDLLAQAETGQADMQAAHAALQESLTIWRELAERRHLAFANADLGITAVWQGDLSSAVVRLHESCF